MIPLNDTSHANNHECTTRKVGPKEIEAIAPLWETLNQNPNSQFDFFRLVNRIRNAEPWVTVISRGPAAEGMVIGRIAVENLKTRIGYKTITLRKARTLHIIYGGILGQGTEDVAAAILTSVKDALRRGEADLAIFSHLATDSVLYQLLVKRTTFIQRDCLATKQAHWTTKLSVSFPEFLNKITNKHRTWIRRLERVLERDHPGQVTFRCVKDAAHLAEALVDLEAIAAKTYQRQLGAGFQNDLEHSERFKLEAEKGWLRIYILYINSKPCAFWIGTVYKNIFFSDFTGYDPVHRKYELGTVIFARMIEALCEEKVTAIDYGLGDAFYKQRFGDHRQDEASFALFAPRAGSISLNLVKTALEAPPYLARRFIESTNLEQRLKTFWRRRLLKGDGAANPAS